ncbi:hypothetical protein HanPSC8_Chr01g0003321 [Helianthus annuus]|nr:hypothetical protein HanPSC8_Chr01g0003321 [Helianthus annuus]
MFVVCQRSFGNVLLKTVVNVLVETVIFLTEYHRFSNLNRKVRKEPISSPPILLTPGIDV